MIGRLARRQRAILHVDGSDFRIARGILQESSAVGGDAFHRSHVRSRVASSLTLAPGARRPPRTHLEGTGGDRRRLLLLVAMMEADVSLIPSARHGPVFVSLAAGRGAGAPGARPPLRARQGIATLLQFLGNVAAILLVPPIVVVVVALSRSVSRSRAAGLAALAPRRVDPVHDGAVAVALDPLGRLGTLLLDAALVVDVIDLALLEDLPALDRPLLDALAAGTGAFGSPGGEPGERAVVAAPEANPRRPRQMPMALSMASL